MRFRKWQKKSVTEDEHKLMLETILKNLNHQNTGGPLSGRDPKLVQKLKSDYKIGRGQEREFAHHKWEGPSLRDLATRKADEATTFDEFAFDGHRRHLPHSKPRR